MSLSDNEHPSVPPKASLIGTTEPFSVGFAIGAGLVLSVGLGGGTLMALLIGDPSLSDVWDPDWLLRVGVASVVVGLVFGGIFATPTAPPSPRREEPRPDEELPDPLEVARLRLMASRRPSPVYMHVPELERRAKELAEAAEAEWDRLRVPDNEFGHYAKRLFDHIQANHLDTPFTYADLPEPDDRVHSAYRNPEPAAGMPEDAEIIRVGSASKHAKSDVIRELNNLEVTRTVDLETFQLTPKGREVTMEIGG